MKGERLVVGAILALVLVQSPGAAHCQHQYGALVSSLNGSVLRGLLQESAGQSEPLGLFKDVEPCDALVDILGDSNNTSPQWGYFLSLIHI